MAVIFRTYIGGAEVTEDYRKVHDFLVESKNTEYTYGRFDWMITNRDYLEEQYLSKIGLWEENGKIVAADLFDTSLDDIFPITLTGYEYLYPEMLKYAMEYMIKEDEPDFRVYICDTNKELQKTAKKAGLIPTSHKEMVAMYDLTEEIPASNLPKKYKLTSLSEEKDYEKVALCLFKGFGHEEGGEVFQFTKETERKCQEAYEREYVNLSLRVSVKDAQGNYCAHTGMWYDKNTEIALIEPVCTIPTHRKLGIGREVVLEGLRRVKALGAKKAVVGSNLQFYYSIGLVPHSTGTYWVMK